MKYSIGQHVVERINPSRNLIITRYAKGIYYVKTAKYFTNKKELVYLESELANAERDEVLSTSTDNIFMSPLKLFVKWWRIPRFATKS